MKNFASTVFLLFLLSIFAFAQNPDPAPTPPDDENILKITTTLIQVDVTVTDKKGNVVTDLKPEDFEIYENGKRQEITNFSFISVNPQTKQLENNAQSKNADKRNQLPVPPVKLKPEQIRRTYAIVVDDLGISFENVSWMQQNLRKFINEQMQEGDLVAIIRTGIGIGALQSFTSDKRLLLAAIDKIRWNPQGRGGIHTFAPIVTTLKEDLSGRKTSDGEVKNPEGVEQDKEFARQIEEFRNENFTVGTLGALNYIMRGMRDLPGRKSIMLISEGFVLTKNGAPTRIFDSMRILADAANRSSVVIYTLDPRGLQIPGMANAGDDIREILPDNFDPGSFVDQKNQRESDFFETQMSLRYLAYETGGFPFENQNNLSKGLQRAIDDQNSYYLLGYQPDEDTFDPKKNKFNKLEIKVKRPDLKVRYRSGFLGITDERIKKAAAQTPQQQLVAALVSPFGADEINLDLYSIFYNDERNRNFIRSLVFIDPKDLTFKPGADGLYHAKFDVIAMIFDATGKAADNNITSQALKFTADQLSKVRQTGIIYDLPVPVTKTGAYQFRIALRDSTTGKIGAVSQFIEVPNLKKNKLTLSNLVLENFTPEEWKKISLGQTPGASDRGGLLDTTVRRFRSGTLLRYSYVIYNAKIAGAQKPQMQIQTRLIRDGKVILDGSPTPFNSNEQTDLKRLRASGAITLGKDLTPGNYILQVIVSDNARTEKQNFATQFVQFEIVK